MCLSSPTKQVFLGVFRFFEYAFLVDELGTLFRTKIECSLKSRDNQTFLISIIIFDNMEYPHTLKGHFKANIASNLISTFYNY